MVDVPVSESTLADFLMRPNVQTYFQPIVHLGSRLTLGFEALSRFPQGTGPVTWIEAARRYGRIIELDHLLFVSGVRSFFASRLPGVVFVNVEAAHLSAVGSWLQDLQEQGVLPPEGRRRLVFEVTEREPSPLEGWQEAGRAARRRGFFLSLDDAQPKLSFARHLRRLRPQFVKLDRTVLVALLRDPERGERHLRRWLAYAQRQEATLIAEGVEDLEQGAFLLRSGVHFAQGYALGRPAPPESWVVGRR